MVSYSSVSYYKFDPCNKLLDKWSKYYDLTIIIFHYTTNNIHFKLIYDRRLTCNSLDFMKTKANRPINMPHIT